MTDLLHSFRNYLTSVFQHHRMTFTGDEYDFKDSKYQELYKAGFQEAATYIGWKLADIGLDVFKFEKALFEVSILSTTLARYLGVFVFEKLQYAT